MKSRATLAALTMGATLSLASCSLAANITTSNPYDASDGVSIEVGSITARNVLFVTSGADQPGVLTGTLVNSAAKPVKVTLVIGEDSKVIVVPADASVQLGPADGQKEFSVASPAAPGGIVNVTLTPADAAGQTDPIPVMDGTQSQYQHVIDELAKG